MKTSRFGTAVLAAVAVLAALSSPGYAQQHRQKTGKTGTIVKWVLIGAGAGAAIGFAAGFHAYDDVSFAELKIAEASIAGAGIGGAFGALFGISRAQAGASPSRSAQPILWIPSSIPRPGMPAAKRPSSGREFVGPPPLRPGVAGGR